MYILLIMAIFTTDQETSRAIDQQEALQIAEAVRANLVENVKDYTGLFIKREYLNGADTGHQYMQFKFREQPLGVYLKFLKPPSLENREVLYTGGTDMLVKRGGRRNSNLTLSVGLDSPVATESSRNSIQDMGLRKLVDKLIEKIKTEIAIPGTEIVAYYNAKLDGRAITHYRLIHSVKSPETTCRMAEISIDKELNIPIYYRALGWDEPTVVLEEYAFRNVVLNVGLTDKDFAADNPEYGFKQHQDLP
jgi:hypothetical protein